MRISTKTQENELSYFQILLEIITDAIPSTFGLLFIFLIETINIIFVGRLNDPELISGIGIGTLYVNVTGYVLGVGLIGGLDTLCSQSYGAENYRLMGVYRNTTRVSVSIIFFVLILPLNIFCYMILIAINQSPIVASFGATYAKTLIPALFFGIHYNIQMRYLQSMKIFVPGMIVTLVTSLLHCLWAYLFIYHMDFGIMGAGFAMTTTQILNYILITIYIEFYNPCPESNFNISKDSITLDSIYGFLKYAVPAAVLFSADWIGFEIQTLLSSYMGEVSFAANVCYFNFATTIFMLPLGISYAASSLVGNSIGENKPKLAKKYGLVCAFTGFSLVFIICIFLFFYRRFVPGIYTGNQEISDLMVQILILYVFFGPIDSLQVVFNGIIKGIGLQFNASIGCLIVLFPINVPLCLFLGFYMQYGVVGLWYGQYSSMVMLFLIYGYILFNADWESIAHNTVKELNEESGKLSKKDN